MSTPFLPSGDARTELMFRILVYVREHEDAEGLCDIPVFEDVAESVVDRHIGFCVEELYLERILSPLMDVPTRLRLSLRGYRALEVPPA